MVRSIPPSLVHLLWKLTARAVVASPTGTPSDNTEDGYLREAAALRTFLRRFPFWRDGHLMLARLAITHNDLASAYACAQALSMLSPPDSQYQGKVILGQCFLRHGDPSGALQCWNGIDETKIINQRERDSLTEERAAAHMALGNVGEARSLLAAIPPERRSPEGQAAWEYVSRKVH